MQALYRKLAVVLGPSIGAAAARKGVEMGTVIMDCILSAPMALALLSTQRS